MGLSSQSAAATPRTPAAVGPSDVRAEFCWTSPWRFGSVGCTHWFGMDTGSGHRSGHRPSPSQWNQLRNRRAGSRSPRRG